MFHLTRRATLAALQAALLSRSLPSFAAPAAAVLPGTYALPEGKAEVSASLVTLPGLPGAPTGTRLLDVVMTRLGTTKPITRYDVELSKRLHLIAISDDLQTFLHEHGEQPGADGHFHVSMNFPHGGAWHIYADAVPTGVGQQVMRFEVNLDAPEAPPTPRPVALRPNGLESADGHYGVRFDTLDLRAGQEAELSLHVLRDGKAAPDLTPYLGVAAHAVFISASDLTYVHAHAAPATSGGSGAPMGHDMSRTSGMAMGTDHPGGHGARAGMGGAALRPGTLVPPDLTLHVRAPKAGVYLLWLQFMAGGRVRTVPFVVAVT